MTDFLPLINLDVEEDDVKEEEHLDLLACRKCHPVCPFSIARVRVDDETLGSVLYSGGELVIATHGRWQIFNVAL
jgi:hypothetical protein